MCLVNWYLDGNHYIGPHSDDEKQFGDNKPIYSLSWCATRQFKLLKKKDVDGIDYKIDLEDGDLIIMCGTCQKTHTHQVPKTKKCNKSRINFTFRTFVNEKK